MLFGNGYLVQLIDGDNIRSGVNSNLGFSLEDRLENIRRIAEVNKLFLNCGIITLNSFVSPTKKIRKKAQNIIGENDFYEVYINTSLKECESRDVKGLYAKARAGQIKGFTGIDSPYEAPTQPALTIHTADQTVNQSAIFLYNFILEVINNGNL
jgi:adenylylsulfate kinase